MRRRIDTAVFRDGNSRPKQGHSTSPVAAPSVPDMIISEVPELWRKHASQPWRVMFPDLDWKP